jgi:alkanesulfonate monooxygenase SsuD/methylene tetrahydromethanopterin reductase-like flavin-dependent oxidoreductase (luciferase family)
MKFGLVLSAQYMPDEAIGPRVQELVQQVRVARDLGFTSVWAIHHYLADFKSLQPFPLLSRMIPESGEMLLGTSIFVAPLEHPIDLAENVATLDALSGGRVIFGVGQGYRKHEFDNFGIPLSYREGRLLESLEVMRKLWREDRVTFHGTHFNVENATLHNKPVNRHIPVWIGASYLRGIRLAARAGDAWIIGPAAKKTVIAKQLSIYREELALAGKPTPDQFPIFREVSVAQTREQAISRARPYLELKYRKYSEWGYTAFNFEEQLAECFIIGGLDDVAEQLADYEERFGVNHLLARVQWPGMPVGQAIETIELLGTEVLPKLRGR